MAKSKYTDFICILVVVFMLVVTVAFMNNGFFGLVTIATNSSEDSVNSLLESDETWMSSSFTYIYLEDDNSTISNTSHGYIAGNQVVIEAGGVYVLEGTLSEGSVLVQATTEESVQIVLNNASITSSDSAPIFIYSAKDAAITVAEGTTNTLALTGECVSTIQTQLDVKGAVYSTCDLVLNGTGSLSVSTSYLNGIITKDDLIVESGSYTVDAVNNGIVGKDSVTVYDGTFNITAGNDGMKSNNTSDTGKGYVEIENGTFTIVAAHDGIQAATTVTITDGNFDITTGTGSGEITATEGFSSMGGGGMGGGRMNADSDSSSDDSSSHSQSDSESQMTPPSAPAGNDSSDSMGSSDATTVSNTTSSDTTDTSQADNTMPSGEPDMSGATDSSSDSTTTDGTAPSGAPDMSDRENGEMPDMSDMGNGEMPDMSDMESTEESDSEESEESEETVSDSYKGIKATGELTISGGTFKLDTQDDSIHGDSTVTISGGTFEIASGCGDVKGNGIHSDDLLTISDGTITVTAAYEGLEGYSVLIEGGVIDVTSSDDGINASGEGSESSMMGGFMGGDDSDDEDTAYIKFTGGITTINLVKDADGIDSNGAVYVEGGQLYIAGYNSSGNQPIDWDSKCVITGGIVAAIGQSGMQESLSDASTQSSILYEFTDTVSAGTEITLSTTDGEVLVSYTSSNDGNLVIFSSPDLTTGETYVIAAGDQTEEITLDQTVYSNSSSSMGGGMGQGMGQGQRGGQDMQMPGNESAESDRTTTESETATEE